MMNSIPCQRGDHEECRWPLCTCEHHKLARMPQPPRRKVVRSLRKTELKGARTTGEERLVVTDDGLETLPES